MIIYLITLVFPMSLLAVINDPTKPIYSEGIPSSVVSNPIIKKSKEILLQSIFHSLKNKTIVINGRIMTENESFDGIFIHRISKDKVVIKYKEIMITLRVSKKIYIDKDTGKPSEK